MLKSVGSFWWRRSASCILSRTCSGHSESNHFHAKSNVEKVETVDVKRNRLQYQSRKRGMLENCILLSTFSEKYLPTFTSTQLDLYDHLLNDPSNDWDIFYWATGLRETPQEFQNEVMGLLKVHVKNHEKQPRSLHPKLLTDE